MDNEMLQYYELLSRSLGVEAVLKDFGEVLLPEAEESVFSNRWKTLRYESITQELTEQITKAFCKPANLDAPINYSEFCDWAWLIILESCKDKCDTYAAEALKRTRDVVLGYLSIAGIACFEYNSALNKEKLATVLYQCAKYIRYSGYCISVRIPTNAALLALHDSGNFCDIGKLLFSVQVS